MRSGRFRGLLVAALIAGLAIPSIARASPARLRIRDVSAPSSVGNPTWSDFDGDSRADLAIGAPWDKVGGATAAGAVNVIYASAEGLTPANSQVFAGSRRYHLTNQANDHFGLSLAAGDFNNDGFGDLAIGVPDEDAVILNTTVPNVGGSTFSSEAKPACYGQQHLRLRYPPSRTAGSGGQRAVRICNGSIRRDQRRE